MFGKIVKFARSFVRNRKASTGGIFAKLLGLFLGITMGVALVPDAIRTLANATTWADTGTVIASLGTVALPIVVMGVFILLLLKESGIDL